MIHDQGLDRLEGIESQVKGVRQDLIIFKRDISAKILEVLQTVKALQAELNDAKKKKKEKKEKKKKEQKASVFGEMSSAEKRLMYKEFEEQHLLSMAVDTQPIFRLAVPHSYQFLLKFCILL